MDDDKIDLVRQWLTKALHDIESAHVLAENRGAYYDTAVFHCQQAAEKSLKGFLVFHDIEFDKTHDISSLIDLVTPIKPEFTKWATEAESLTVYAIAGRYPDEDINPTQEDYVLACNTARTLYDLALSFLPTTAWPNKK